LPSLLYSTNTYLKFLVQERYGGGRHYVWCSTSFDGRKLSAYSKSGVVPPSSNPAEIYRDLKEGIARNDRHSPKIASQRALFLSLASQWSDAGDLAVTDAADLAYLVSNAPLSEFRPLLYIIPYEPVKHRIETVPAHQRANPSAEEFRIVDLLSTEFDIVEF